MNKEDTINTLCQLLTFVKDNVFNNQVPADCFCNECSFNDSCFCMHPDIIKFVQDAVAEKIKRNQAIPVVQAVRIVRNNLKLGLKETLEWMHKKGLLYWDNRGKRQVASLLTGEEFVREFDRIKENVL